MEAPSRHRRDSYPSDEVVGGLVFDFERLWTESCSAQAAEELPPLPDRGDGAKGVLPRVLKNIISKRREVKGLLKKEKNVKKRETYEIRQVPDSASVSEVFRTSIS